LQADRHEYMQATALWRLLKPYYAIKELPKIKKENKESAKM